MSDKPINKMDFKELRNEVQTLRDEIAKMKRFYEDLFYNLDSDNFSSVFKKEQDNMKTQIEITSEGIKTKVSKDDLDNSLKEYSTTAQTASLITSTVSKEYLKQKLDGEYATETEMHSTINQAADEIYVEVASNYDVLNGKISTVSNTAESIESKVGVIENGKFKEYTLFTQNKKDFTFVGGNVVFTKVIQLADNAGNPVFNIFHDESNPHSPFVALWKSVVDDLPVVIGDNTETVYLASRNDANKVATQGWVQNNMGTATAVFG